MQTIITDYDQKTIRKTEETFFRALMKEIRREFFWAPKRSINLLVSMESWKLCDDGRIVPLGVWEEIPEDWYETWISVFLYHDGNILCCEDGREVPSACTNMLKLHREGAERLLSMEEAFVDKTREQLTEVLEEWQRNPLGYQEGRAYTEQMTNRAKWCELAFETAESDDMP